MNGVVYIDGVDIYKVYGVSVSESAYDDLVCLPKLKTIQFNDWHERNGIEPDLSEPVIAAMSVTIPFFIDGDYERFSSFLSLFSDKAYHTFYFATIGVTKELRLTKTGMPKSISGLSTFSLTFSDDVPLKDYRYSAPSSSLVRLRDFVLDGVDVASYGIRILKGSMDSITASPDVKENLRTDISIVSGVSYDGEIVTYKSRTAEIKCLMRAADANEFWRNRNALLYNLTKPGERSLYVAAIDKSIPCYYKDCKVSCFYPDKGKFWFEFTISLEFFNGVI